jgi:branched-chain amino acid transport system permease protein
MLRATIWSAAAIILGLIVAFTVSSGTALSLFTQATIYAVFALGIGLLLRQSGMVSFGNAAFFGAAGYIVAILLNTKATSAEAAILVSIASVTTFAFLLGLVAVRVSGIAFGMLTLAVGQVFYLSAFRSSGVMAGADGMTIDWPPTLFGLSVSSLLQPSHIFLLSWCSLVVIMLMTSLLLSLRFGSITEAVRDNEERARFIGIRTLLPRVAVFTLSAAVTSFAGVLSAFNTGFISPESLHWSISGVALMMVVVGGYKVLWGPPLGAVTYFLAKDRLGEFASDHWMAIFGIALISVIVLLPDGLAGGIQRLFRHLQFGSKAPLPGANNSSASTAEPAVDPYERSIPS